MSVSVFDPDLFLTGLSGDNVFLEKSFRTSFAEVLDGDVEFLRLAEGSKFPVGSYRVGGWNRLKNIPLTGNFGVIPVNRLFVLDFDLHRSGSSSVEEQLSFFSDFLRVDLRSSLAVVTQTGGLHVYLRFPWGVDSSLVKNFPRGSLRGYSKAFSRVSGENVVLDADVRSGLSNGYIVGPSSRVDASELDSEMLHGEYWVADETVGFDSVGEIRRPLMIDSLAMQRLEEVVDVRRKFREGSGNGKSGGIDFVGKVRVPEVDDGVVQSNDLPPESVLGDLRVVLNDRLNGKEFHVLRAFVKSSLHCCYSDRSVALTCRELGVDRDSYSDSVLSFNDLVADVNRFVPDKRFHGVYCDVGRANNFRVKQEVLEERLNFFREQVRNRSVGSRVGPRIVQHRVIDSYKVLGALRASMRRNSKGDSQQVIDAFNIFEVFFQPLLNVGSDRVVLARSAIERELGITGSRAAAGVRLLRSSGIIVVHDKQRTGLAATYKIPKHWENEKLTGLLRFLWWNSVVPGVENQRASLVFNVRMNCFQDAITGVKVLILDNDLRDSVVLPVQLKKNPVELAFNYLKAERSERETSNGFIEAEFPVSKELNC